MMILSIIPMSTRSSPLAFYYNKCQYTRITSLVWISRSAVVRLTHTHTSAILIDIARQVVFKTMF